MKIRNGFVSNSSSSSFIIGYARIKDRKLFNDYCTKHQITYKEVTDAEDLAHSYAEVNVANSCSIFDSTNRLLSVTNDQELLIPKEIEYDWNHHEGYLVVKLGNDEGDEEFWDAASNELDWDKAKDIDFWQGSQRALIELFQNDKIIDIRHAQVIFGAERNG